MDVIKEDLIPVFLWEILFIPVYFFGLKLSSARFVIERAFGQLKARFGIL